MDGRLCLSQCASMQERLAVIGCGRVGSNLALALHSVGRCVAVVVDENDQAAQACAAAVGAQIAGCAALPNDLTMIFIAVADDQIAAVSRCITVGPQTVVCHLSGALNSEVLKPAGLLTASCHPVQTFSQPLLNSQSFLNIWFALEGEEAALQRLQPVLRDLKGQWFIISREKKSLYHLACTLASNYLVGIAYLAQQILHKADVDSMEPIAGIMTRTLENIVRQGPAEALTGPIVRGDVATVQKHLDAIKSQAPEILIIYQTLGQQLISLARQRQDSPAYHKLEEMLHSGF